MDRTLDVILEAAAHSQRIVETLRGGGWLISFSSRR